MAERTLLACILCVSSFSNSQALERLASCHPHIPKFAMCWHAGYCRTAAKRVSACPGLSSLLCGADQCKDLRASVCCRKRRRRAGRGFPVTALVLKHTCERGRLRQDPTACWEVLVSSLISLPFATRTKVYHIPIGGIYERSNTRGDLVGTRSEK